ncbi:hypoxanthine phosphoribosyltransferase [Rubritalea profundi]|uniref:Hypoxanthine phosphoribosyltransferase n=1 Tax=Rubritalea profundi TaxID=1658618 RepID=A0A2S7U7Z9_9BACT|nr:hypoxanthine phosphoribosyltransferase [Rubritalea profundi]
MHRDVERILINEEEIRERLDFVAKKVMAEFACDGLVVVILLKGALVFAADMCRRLPVTMTVECLNISSYHGDIKTSGKVEFLDKKMPEVADKKVLIMDDILDTGLTMRAVTDALLALGAAEVRNCVLLNKRKQRAGDCEADFKAFDIDDEFVIGYGLDYQGRYRNLPYVGVMKQGDI